MREVPELSGAERLGVVSRHGVFTNNYILTKTVLETIQQRIKDEEVPDDGTFDTSPRFSDGKVVLSAKVAHHVIMHGDTYFTLPVVDSGHRFSLFLEGQFLPTFAPNVEWGTPPSYHGRALFTFITFNGGHSWIGEQVL